MSRPTSRSVAEAAGVSTATVSYAFNRPDRLSAASRARVLAVARELGYAGPDARGRSLRTGRAGAIGVILTVDVSYAFTDPYLLQLLSGLAEQLQDSRTSLTLIPFPAALTGLAEDEVRASIDAVHRAVIDGAVTDGLPAGHPAVRALAERGIPLIHSSDTGADRFAAIDERQAGREVGEHLAALGHREVAMVVAGEQPPGQLVQDPYSSLRVSGLRTALGRAVQVVSGGRNALSSGAVAAAALLDRPSPPTAIACDSDVLALTVLSEASRRGLVPGRDISISGFDDIPGAAEAGLTTVRQPIREKARLMARMLFDPALPSVVLPTELVVRTSTGPVSGGAALGGAP
jgi:DNA-binding LacI/PurR family transcriptional regulator